jgi:hypothetical protein
MDKKKLVDYLERYWTENKAKGLMAQLLFEREVKNGIYSEYRRKFFSGCWVLAPKRGDFFRFRFCFFIHPALLQDVPSNDIEPEDILGETEGLKFRMVAGFLIRAGMGVVYVIPTGKDPLPPENIQWFLYRYNDEKEVLRQINADTFFSRWGGVGRPGYGETWSTYVRQDYAMLEEEELLSLLLNEAFYTTFLKGRFKKSVSDPYDVDGFLLSYSTRTILPLEIKEKFPAGSGDSAFFGIDAGRVLMLLRLCLPNDANAFYVIREVSEMDRRFIDWKFMPLSEIIISASWNLQRGGKGMGGQETQTIRLPYHGFRRFEPAILSDRSLEEVGNLPKEVKRLAVDFKRALESEFGGDG